MEGDATDAVEDAPGAEAISYAEFGERFFLHAVTEERIVAGLRGLAGEPIEFGPIGAGPGKFAKVSATGELGLASARRLEGELIAFHLVIPVALDLLIDLGLDKHTFHADVEVNLELTARAADPLRVLIEVEPPSSKDVTVELEADGIRAEVLSRVGSFDREIRRFIARYVAREIDKPQISKARDIDVAARIDHGWRR